MQNFKKLLSALLAAALLLIGAAAAETAVPSDSLYQVVFSSPEWLVMNADGEYESVPDVDISGALLALYCELSENRVYMGASMNNADEEIMDAHLMLAPDRLYFMEEDLEAVYSQNLGPQAAQAIQFLNMLPSMGINLCKLPAIPAVPLEPMPLSPLVSAFITGTPEVSEDGSVYPFAVTAEQISALAGAFGVPASLLQMLSPNLEGTILENDELSLLQGMLTVSGQPMCNLTIQIVRGQYALEISTASFALTLYLESYPDENLIGLMAEVVDAEGQTLSATLTSELDESQLPTLVLDSFTTLADGTQKPGMHLEFTYGEVEGTEYLSFYRELEDEAVFAQLNLIPTNETDRSGVLDLTFFDGNGAHSLTSSVEITMQPTESTASDPVPADAVDMGSLTDAQKAEITSLFGSKAARFMEALQMDAILG